MCEDVNEEFSFGLWKGETSARTKFKKPRSITYFKRISTPIMGTYLQPLMNFLEKNIVILHVFEPGKQM
jgi:hypothetical protein